jgi:hypothetical protein
VPKVSAEPINKIVEIFIRKLPLPNSAARANRADGEEGANLMPNTEKWRVSARSLVNAHLKNTVNVKRLDVNQLTNAL